MAIAKKTKTTARKRVVKSRKKSAPFLEASALGVVPEQLAIMPILKTPLFSPLSLPHSADAPPGNLPVAPLPLFHRPLVSGRTSFWLGVGFGMFVVGMLTFVAWKLLTVEAVQALW